MELSMVNLSQWIDNMTGDITAALSRRDEKTLIDEVHRMGVEDLLGHELLNSDCPDMLKRSVLRIELSEEIKETTAKVHPGIYHNRDVRDDDSKRDLPADTRELPMEHKSVLLGEFKAAQGRGGIIYLYTRAMATCDLTSKLGFEAVFWATLAHNMFYAFLYHQLKIAGKGNRWRSGAKRDRETVKASLAAYFEGCFLGYPFRYLEDEWASLDVEGWPSSGALAIIYSHRENELFRELFNMAFFDWKTAADILRTGYYMFSSRIQEALL